MMCNELCVQNDVSTRMDRGTIAPSLYTVGFGRF